MSPARFPPIRRFGMPNFSTPGFRLTAAASALVLLFTACAPPEKDAGGDQTQSGVRAGEATSAADFGGLDGLIDAAKKEGELNVIALPPDWANYGEVISAFEDKYDIKVSSDQPDAASQDEINAANDLKGTDRAPDEAPRGTFHRLRPASTLEVEVEAPHSTCVPRRDGDPRSRRRLRGSREGVRHHH